MLLTIIIKYCLTLRMITRHTEPWGVQLLPHKEILRINRCSGLAWGIIGVCLLHAAGTADNGINWHKILAGEVIAETVKSPEGIPGVRAMFVVSAPRERIWETLLDYANFTKIFKGIEKIRLLESTPAGAQIEYWIDAVFKKYHYIVFRHYDDPGHRLTWT